REKEIVECFEYFYDHLLVHGDPRLARFERSFGGTARIADKLHYTGFVVQDAAPEGGDAGAEEVLVSAGGGAVGQRLLETAIAARALSSLRDRNWRVLAGINAEDFGALQARAGNGVIVERFRNDFTLRLRNCVLSVSQAGYNTVLETLQARARAVVVPFAGVAESEQTLRANLLAERGLLEVVEEAALTPATLAAAIDRAAERRVAARVVGMSWGELETEIRRRGDAGRPVEFWWRDDDASVANGEVERLLELS